jgi:hypothetical protein
MTKRRLRENEVAAMRRFRLMAPEWDGVPDEALADTFLFRSWLLGQQLDEVGWSILTALRRLPLIGRRFR